MKDCCNTGDEDSGAKLKKQVLRILWAVALLLVLGIALIQILEI